MRSFVVVEGWTDAILIRPLIMSADIPHVEIIEAGGRSSAMSLGNSIALSQLSRVAVVVDADTIDRKSIEEQQTVFLDLQPSMPAGGNCRLYLAIPTLEEDLFPTADDFVAIYGIELTERQKVRFSQDRKSVIKEFYSAPRADSSTTLRIGRMDSRAAQSGWNNKLLSELFRFLRTGSATIRNGSRR